MPTLCPLALRAQELQSGFKPGIPGERGAGGTGVTCRPASAKPSAIPGTARGPGHFGSESGGPLPVEGYP